MLKGEDHIVAGFKNKSRCRISRYSWRHAGRTTPQDRPALVRYSL